MDSYTDSDLPDQDGRKLRQACGIHCPPDPTDTSDLPPDWLRMYWLHQQGYQRLGLTMPMSAYVDIMVDYKMHEGAEPDKEIKEPESVTREK